MTNAHDKNAFDRAVVLLIIKIFVEGVVEGCSLALRLLRAGLPDAQQGELIYLQEKSSELEAWWVLSYNHRGELLPRFGIGLLQLRRSAEQLVSEFSPEKEG